MNDEKRWKFDGDSYYLHSYEEMLQTELEAIKAKIVELTAELEVADKSTGAIEDTVV